MKNKLVALSTLLMLLISTIPFYLQTKPVEASMSGSSLIVGDAVNQIHAPRNAAAGSAVTAKAVVTNLGVPSEENQDDSISGPAGLKAYYFDGSKGLLNPSDGNTWEMTVTNIDASLITGNKAFMFIVQDQGTGSGWESLIIQVHMNFYGAGGHLLQSFDNGWVLKSSHGFNPGDVPGKFDLRMLVQDLGPNYLVTPQFRLPSGVWQTFYDGSWTSANYELTKTRLAMQIDAGGGGTVTFDKPLAYSNGIWYADPNTTIQAAINAANSGQTIRAFNGAYHENLVVNKALTIKAASNPVIDGGAAGNCISVSANNVVISGFEIRNGYNGISGQTSGSTFSNNTIHDNLNIPGSAGVGILLWGDNDNNIITGNTIYDNDRQGIFIGYYDTTYISTGNIISYNTIHNNGLYRYANGPDASDYGIQLWTADNNVIEYNEIYDHDDWFPWGGTFDFAQGIYLCDSDSNLVTHNYLHSNNYGVGLWHPSRPVVTNTINYNNIAGNTGYGICTFDGPPAVYARFNWWGDASGPTHSSNPGGTGDAITDNVDYSPWLGFVVGTSPMTWHVNPTGGSDAIQEALDEASDGDTIIAHAGTYYESQIIVDKSLKVLGSGADTTVIDGGNVALSNVGLVRITANTGNVTFSGFTVKNAGPAGTVRVVIYAASGTAGPTYTISNNKIYGTNTDDPDDYGFYSHGGKERLILTNNLITQTGSNPILLEQHTGETEVSYNILDEGFYGSTVYFSMTYGGLNITTPQKVHHNTIDVGTGFHTGSDYYGGGITFNSASHYGTGNGTYTSVQITDNEIINMKGYRRGISLQNDASGDGSGGEIRSPIIERNIITGIVGETENIGIRLTGLVTDATVSDNNITCTYLGVFIENDTDAQIHNNRIIDFMRGGIVTRGANNIFIEGNTISTTLHDEAPNGIDIGTYSGTSGTVEGNEISGCSWNGFTGDYEASWSGSGILVIESGDSLEIMGNIVHDCDVGMDIESESMNITGNGVHNNIYGFVFWNAKPKVNYNDIYSNTQYGVYRTTMGNLTGALDARYNWWGNVTGPYHGTSWMYMGSPYGPHYGLGDNVTDYVLYYPWLSTSSGPPVQPPTANFTWSPQMPRATESVTFNASSSTPNGGTIVTYTWDFGDGNITSTSNPVVTHVYANPNRYNVTLTVLDSEGLTDSITKKVKITHIADLNLDGKVNILDISIVAKAFGTKPGDPRWNQIADVTRDGKVNIIDVSVVAKNFGWNDP